MLVILLACAPTAPKVGASEATVEEVPGTPDSTDPQFDPSVIHELVLTVAPEDWDILRNQRRSYYDLLGDDCMVGPWPSPYTYVSAEVTLDGESLGTVGVRKKGLIGSDSPIRPSLRIDTDHYVPGQHFHGMEKLVFNNNNQDPGSVRSCLAHQLFADAGLVAPRCSLTHVTVNGKDLGIYSHVESIDPDLVARFRGESPTVMYEGTLSDFREGWLQTFDPKTPEADGSELAAAQAALEGDDEGLLDRLEPLVDLEGFFTFWAAESLAGHWDGYNGNTNNFYVYLDPQDSRLHFIASGPDAAFDSRQPFAPTWVATASALANRLIQTDDGKARYEAELQRQLDEVWDKQARLAQLSAWKDLLDPYNSRAMQVGLQTTWDVVSHREDDLRAGMGTPFTPPALRGNVCWTSHGMVTVEFSTSWASYPDGDLFTGGQAAGVYTIDGTSYPATAEGVSIGTDPDSGLVLWLDILTLAPDTFLASYVTFDASQMVAGSDIPLDGHPAQAALLYNGPDTGGQWTTAAYLALGALHLDAASTVPGGVVSGWMEGQVMGSE